MSDDLVSLGASLALIDELYEQFQRDRDSVDPAWRALFQNGHSLEHINGHLAAHRGIGVRGPGDGHGRAARERQTGHPVPVVAQAPLGVAQREPGAAVLPGGNVWPLVNAYRVRGHMAADLDPLGMIQRPPRSELEPASYGFTPADLDTEIDAGGLYGVKRATLRDILARLQAAYCDTIGLEFMHISTPVKKQWLAERMETRDRRPVSDALRVRMLDQVIAAETFERFCHTKYPGTKRFSLEGSEGLLPLLDLVLEHSSRLGAIEAVLGMAHRGRLNVLANVMGRAPRDIFCEFDDIEPEATLGGGDVKYHLGYSCDRTDAYGHNLHVSLAFNPSHLEAVDPVVVGRVRAKQRRHDDWEHMRVVGILIHGDAAFAGQGLVAETLQLSNLHGFRTGGTVHLIVNNQIGFTASPQESRSTPYCTDIAKMIQCPIWHVNGEDLDAVAHVVEMAMEYRALFQSDVVIDMFCYRKFGHNEMDEPSFTQPLMYERIQRRPSIVELYGQRLVSRGTIAADHVPGVRTRLNEHLQKELDAARGSGKRPKIQSMQGVWSQYRGGPERNVPEIDTGVERATLEHITQCMTTPSEGLTLHRKVERLLAQRAQMGRGELPLDWGMAEMLAYGSLLYEGHNVRLTGQDSARGTFSHRHALVTDIKTGTEYMLLGHLHPEQGECRIYDSPLSEAGVLGFEYGYSLDYPDALVVWEAQFGDFANGAQVIIDQFIVSGEEKWNRLSGLTMLLPHGYEGQGPEHSSAKLERFLALAAEDNIQVCQPTTPAQVFHLLRRQVHRPWRKPLIVMSPKSLLRLPEATSTIEELTRGQFQRILLDPAVPAGTADADRVRKVFLCTGKIYYELVAERQRRGDGETAILRLEQLYPLSAEVLAAQVAAYRHAEQVVWVQDEPENMGALPFLLPRLNRLFGTRFRWASRDESASPATGSHKAHAIEQQRLLDKAFAQPAG